LAQNLIFVMSTYHHLTSGSKGLRYHTLLQEKGQEDITLVALLSAVQSQKRTSKK